MKIITILGARPQFIKAATVSRVIHEHDKSNLHEVIIHTGQHYDVNMSDVFFAEMRIPQPDYNLGIGGGSHGAMTGQMLEKIEYVLLKEKPDVVMVYGDTNSTLAGALAAAKLHIPVAHVESGLRSFNRKMPEEINRILTDNISDFLFAPSQCAIRNLEKEGFAKDKIFDVGDVMYDATLFYAELSRQQSEILRHLQLSPKFFILATVHRAENTDDPQRLTSILQALNHLSDRYPVVFPLHPRTQKQIANFNIEDCLNKMILIEPVGYLDMIALESNARLIVTDSGGIQKEAYFHRVPCVTVRSETEWLELLDIGCNRLAEPNNIEKIIEVCNAQIDYTWKETIPFHPYGQGRASELIVTTIASYVT